MFKFTLDEHQLKQGITVIRIWRGGDFMAAIFPTERGIKVVSKCFEPNPGAAIEIDKLPPVPAILINLI